MSPNVPGVRSDGDYESGRKTIQTYSKTADPFTIKVTDGIETYDANGSLIPEFRHHPNRRGTHRRLLPRPG